MLTSLLLIFWLSLFAIFSYLSPKKGLYLLFFILPFYLVKTNVWFAPTTMLELSIYVLFFAWLMKKIIFNQFYKTKARDFVYSWITKIKNFAYPSRIDVSPYSPSRVDASPRSRHCIEQKSKIKHHLPRFFYLLIGLLIFTCLISTIISPDKRTSLGILKGWFFDPLLLAFLILNLIKTKKDIISSIVFLNLSCLFLSLYGLWEYFFYPQSLVEETSPDRLNSIFTSPNYFSLFTGPIIILSIGLLCILYCRICHPDHPEPIPPCHPESANKGSSPSIHRDQNDKKIIRIIFYFCFLIFTLISLFAFYLTKSFGGYLGFLAALFFFFIFFKRKKKWIFFLAFFLIVSITLSFQISSKKFQNKGSVHARYEIWQSSFLMIKKHPILGIGLGNFKEAYQENIEQVTLSPLEKKAILPHNLYLAFLTQTGLLGFLTFLFLIILFFKTGFQKISNPLSLILMSAMVSILIHGLVDTPYWKNDLSCLFWIIIIFVMIIRKDDKERS